MLGLAAVTSYGGLPPTYGAAAAATAGRACVPTAAIACGSSQNELIRRSALSASGATSL